MAKPKIVPRGIRNNNPLNIRIGNTWLGEASEPTDPAFEQFVSMKYGLRAGFVLLRRYIRHYKRTTIFAIISTWAPANENHTEAYIATVAKSVGIAPTDTVKFEDKELMCKIVDAMVRVECGVSVDQQLISAAYDMA